VKNTTQSRRCPEVLKSALLAGALLVTLCAQALDQPAVKVEPNEAGPRALEARTKAAVIRDYLAAWQSMGTALGDNRPDLLDAYFVGTAKDKLAKTIAQQQEAGMSASYRDMSHDLSLVFYSPEGLSVQLLDKVEYEVQIRDHEKAHQSLHVSARYVAVLTPTEVRWKVRILQAKPE